MDACASIKRGVTGVEITTQSRLVDPNFKLGVDTGEKCATSFKEFAANAWEVAASDGGAT